MVRAGLSSGGRGALPLLVALATALLLARSAGAGVVINEIHYHDPDHPLDEFVELWNPGAVPVDIGGWAFTSGIRFQFASGATVDAGQRVVVAADPARPRWAGAAYPVYGPYELRLDDGGETLTLADAQGLVVDTLAYDDYAPWPAAPDGYGPRLERITPALAAADFHAWRASAATGGSPGRPNSVEGIPPRPLIGQVLIDPPLPTPADAPTVTLILDDPRPVQEVILRWQPFPIGRGGTDPDSETLVAAGDLWRYHKGLTDPGADWIALDYDDSGWLEGRGGFGYGDDDDQTELLDMRGNYVAVFIRGAFTVDDPARFNRLWLMADYDDGFAAYLNGEPIARNHLREGARWDEATRDLREAGTPERYDVETSRLRPGLNLLAVEVHNDSLGDSSDLSAIFDLLAGQATALGLLERQPMERLFEGDTTQGTYRCALPPMAAGTLVRMAWEAHLADGTDLRLPHEREPRPFYSFLVPADYRESLLPQLYLERNLATDVPPGAGSWDCAIFVHSAVAAPLLFDGVSTRPSRSGRKLKFLKHEEYEGNRTLNITFARPDSGTTAGPRSPHYEHMSFELFRQAGVLAPWARWHRVYDTDHASGVREIAMNVVIQQPNERFLEMNGRNPEANLYKYTYQGHANQTNPWNGLTEMTTYLGNLARLANTAAARPLALHEELTRTLVVTEALMYEVVSVYLTNWDGFHNNLFLYRDPPERGRWELIPWDLDKTWGYTDGNSMFTRLPLTYPLDGQSNWVSRTPGPVSKPFHSDRELDYTYRSTLRRELDGLFDKGRLTQWANERESTLLAEWALMQAQFGLSYPDVAADIRDAYDAIRTYIERRDAYLRDVLDDYPSRTPTLFQVW